VLAPHKFTRLLEIAHREADVQLNTGQDHIHLHVASEEAGAAERHKNATHRAVVAEIRLNWGAVSPESILCTPDSTHAEHLHQLLQQRRQSGRWFFTGYTKSPICCYSNK